MAETGTAAVSVDQTAYDMATEYALRPETYFDAVSSVKAQHQAMPGSAVKFTITTNLAPAITALTETVDVTPAALSDSQVTVTLAEYGNAVRTTALLRGTSFVVPYDAVVANSIGFNAGVSLDTIARDTLKAATNVIYVTGAARNAQIAATSTITSSKIRQAVAYLRRNNVQSFGGSYVGFIHPDVSYDLRSETGAAAWRDPHVYSQPEDIWNGEIGKYESIRWMEAARAPIFIDSGSTGTTDVYGTMIMGQQALAKAYSFTDGNTAMPKIVPGPVTDVLRRFVPLGWYWLGGYAIYRQEAITRIESASSIGNNSASGSNDPAINSN